MKCPIVNLWPKQATEWWQSPSRNFFRQRIIQEERQHGLCFEEVWRGKSKRWGRNWSKEIWKEKSSIEQSETPEIKHQRQQKTIPRKAAQHWGPSSSGLSGWRGSNLYQLQLYSPLNFYEGVPFGQKQKSAPNPKQWKGRAKGCLVALNHNLMLIINPTPESTKNILSIEIQELV